MELFIYSQPSVVQPLKFDNGLMDVITYTLWEVC